MFRINGSTFAKFHFLDRNFCPENNVTINAEIFSEIIYLFHREKKKVPPYMLHTVRAKTLPSSILLFPGVPVGVPATPSGEDRRSGCGSLCACIFPMSSSNLELLPLNNISLEKSRQTRGTVGTKDTGQLSPGPQTRLRSRGRRARDQVEEEEVGKRAPRIERHEGIGGSPLGLDARLGRRRRERAGERGAPR